MTSIFQIVKVCMCGILFVFIQSCAPAPYLPYSQTQPSVENKGELHANASVTFTNPLTDVLLEGNQNMISTNVLYAASDKMTLHASGNTTLTSVDKRQSIGLGVGTYGHQ